MFLYPSFVSVIDACCSRECAVPFSKIIVDHVVVELKMICSLLFLFQIQTDVYNVVIRLTGMTMRLWNYVSTFSNLSGERLHQIYSKLRQEQDEEAGVGPSHVNGSTPGPIGRDGDPNYFPPFPRQFDRQRGYKNMSNYQITEPVQKGGLDTGKFEAWKRRRRAETENHFQVQPPALRPMNNGSRLPDPNSLGILGAGPSDNRHFGGAKPFRMRQAGVPPRQGFPSGVK